MKAQRTVLATISAMVLLSGAIEAQWVNRPTPGIPRLPNGKPNLTAPVPPRLPDGHPDLSGIWDVGNMLYFHDLARGLKPGELEMTPWAAAVRKQRMARNHVDDPYGYCLPLGVPRINLRSPFKIVQTPPLTAFLHETYVGMIFRQVFTDGRLLPKASDSEPAWLGYSVGKWDGDTFVVDTVGINEQTWMDNAGRPHSDALHTTERYHRGNFGTLDVRLTIDDPKAYTRPWTVNESPSRLILDQDLLEYVCTENNKDVEHLSGAGPK